MDSRIKDTIVRHDKGFNCAQAWPVLTVIFLVTKKKIFSA